MHPAFTIAYMTNRLNPHIEWFLESLDRQCEAESAKVVVVDFYKNIRPTPSWASHPKVIHHVPPKPTVWQGQHRLTRNDYFAAANSRNTAVCLAPDGHLAFVDDLSVLLPGWAAYVQQSMAENYIALGAYKKVRKLVVEGGEIKSFEEHGPGIDTRLKHVDKDQTSCSGGWLFGCSFACPVQAILDVNGLDENCDSTGLGSEDYCLGIRIGNLNKYSFRYDRRMMTYESEEDHFLEKPMLRKDKGVSPNDKSHAMLHAVLGSKWAPNYFGDGGIAGLRQRVLAGEPFPAVQIPDRDWYDGQPLSEL